ncbi:hypothetical protein LWP59_01815 [Amycolatopsis acidiphila]|uniref:hypothetical protein n=1 Tax=Amycolatopsis acidiphila TaxID=715473 RepID=UPI0016437B01|nr:hypothetical protein [Amycolatopsis acidiphila]UIJ60455.1 hypothetical protein LWP59_01815 [Amycolatopsis acidiphila]
MHTTMLPDRPIAPGRFGLGFRRRVAPATPESGTPRALLLTAPSRGNCPMRA